MRSLKPASPTGAYWPILPSMARFGTESTATTIACGFRAAFPCAASSSFWNTESMFAPTAVNGCAHHRQ
jgi:hypothetical protein